jgi:Spy/CpxP family protein refolding chaperone
MLPGRGRQNGRVRRKEFLMRRIHRVSALAFLALALAGPSLAQEASGGLHPGRHWFRECLSILDLTDQQKTDILAVLEAAKPALEADVAAVKAARETLRADLAAPAPNACTIGADALAVQAAVDALRQARDGVRTSIEGTLTADQKTRFEGCLDAPRASVADEAAD